MFVLYTLFMTYMNLFYKNIQAEIAAIIPKACYNFVCRLRVEGVRCNKLVFFLSTRNAGKTKFSEPKVYNLFSLNLPNFLIKL